MAIDPYQPIACSQYDLYEIAIMRGQVVELHWLEPDGTSRQARVKPVGLQTRQGEEYLLVLPQGARADAAEAIRLDRIVTMK